MKTSAQHIATQARHGVQPSKKMGRSEEYSARPGMDARRSPGMLHSSFFIPHSPRPRSAFTMVEIAICLAIIGLALVSIIGVLPIGMNVQRDNREETVINQDATVILESICNGVRGTGFDLTNYIFAITNYQAQYNNVGKRIATNTYGFTLEGSQWGLNPEPGWKLTNNARIIGLLSTPEFTTAAGAPINSLLNGGLSNHIYAYVRAMSGSAVEKPPQNSPILIEDSFSYRVQVVNAPVAVDTNVLALPAAQRVYTDQLTANLHEVRLTFAWPLRPNGTVTPDGPVPQTQRTMVAGTIAQVMDNARPLYYYQSQSFVNTP